MVKESQRPRTEGGKRTGSGGEAGLNQVLNPRSGPSIGGWLAGWFEEHLTLGKNQMEKSQDPKEGRQEGPRRRWWRKRQT